MKNNMDASAPIGIFDSGLGGLAVLRQVQHLLPHEDCLFLGDTARQPYGPQTMELVRQYTIEITGYLVKQGVKMVLIGCNTASAAGGDAAQAQHPEIPVIGMIEAGVLAALQVSRNKRVGVWGTEITVSSHAYHHQFSMTDPAVEVVEVACPEVLRLAEKGNIGNRPHLFNLIKRDFQKIIDFHADTLVLGCTDFTCVRDIIDDVVNKQVMVVDPAEEVVRKAGQILQDLQRLNPQRSKPGCTKFLITGDDGENFSRFGAQFLNVPSIQVTRIPLAELQNSAV